MSHFRAMLAVASLLVLLTALPHARQNLEVYTWTTLAGRAVAPVDGTATAAIFGQPVGVVALADGAVLVADRDGSSIRRVAVDGAVTTFAGRLDSPGWADGALASARFTRPFALARTTGGDLWVGEEILFSGTRLRRITAAGVVSTVAQFSAPLRGLAIASNGDLLVSFGGASVIRVTAAGVQTTIRVGGSSIGTVSNVEAMATHPTFGLVAIVRSTQTGPQRLVALRESGNVTDLAGATTGDAMVVDGVGTSARFASVTALSSDATGRVYVLDSSRVRTFDIGGAVTTVAGPTGFSTPSGLAVRSDGQIAIADTFNRVMRVMTPAAVVSTLSGAAVTIVARDGTGADARFARAAGIDLTASGDLLVADLAAHAIRRVTPAGVVTTFAGQLNAGGFSNGTAGAAAFNFPIDVEVGPSSEVYVVDHGNHAIRVIQPQGGVVTLAGPQPTGTFTPGSGAGFVDGAAVDARFNLPTAIALSPTGDLYVADYGNGAVRVIRANGTVGTLLSGGTPQSRLYFPLGITWAPGGYLIVTEQELVRRVNLDGTHSVIAGGNRGLNAGTSNVDGVGAAASFIRAAGVEVDQAGAMYLADEVKIRHVSAQQVVSTLGGEEVVLSRSAVQAARLVSDGLGSLARFAGAWGLVRRSDGGLYVAENEKIRVGVVSSGTAPTITTEPMDVTTDAGQSATISLQATGAPAPEYMLQRYVQRSFGFPFVIPQFVWEPVLQPAGGFWTTSPSLSTLPTTSSDSGTRFRVVVSNGVAAVVSREITLSVNGPPLLSGIGGDRTMRVGQTRTLSTTVSGGSPTPTLQWQSSSDGVSGWTALTDSSSYTGTSTATLNIVSAPLSLDGIYLRVVATNTHGSAATDAVLITVNPLEFTLQPTSVTPSPGQAATFTAAVNAYGSAVVYQWQTLSESAGWINLADGGTVSGAQTASLIITNASARMSVRLVASANGGSRTSQTANLITVTITFSATPATLSFVARRTATGVDVPVPRTVSIGMTSTRPVTATWSVTSAPAWISTTRLTIGGAWPTGVVEVRVTPGLFGTATDLSGTITFAGTASTDGATTPVTASVSVSLTILPDSANARPFGNLDTPATGTTGLAGAVAVTGWALDDIGVSRVEIWRDCLEAIDRSRGACRATPNGDADAVYVGDALFVSGARPDVASQFSAFPQADRAGWGLMVLTNMLPHIPNASAVGGEGTFLLSAYAIDTAGQATALGRASVAVDNDNSQRPFGAIDSPASGGVLVGNQVFLGWGVGAGNRCLASYRVYVDGVEITTSNGLNVALRTHRPDVDPLFPSSCPSQQKGLGFYLTGLVIPNGRHTVSFEATDTLGNTGQFGSRFFDVLAPVTVAAAPATAFDSASVVATGARSAYLRQIRARVGGDDAPTDTVAKGDDGIYRVTLPVNKRLRLDLDGAVDDAALVVDGVRAPLPGGSSIDSKTGVFTWEPPVGFFGPFVLEFEINSIRLYVVVSIVAPGPLAP